MLVVFKRSHYCGLNDFYKIHLRSMDEFCGLGCEEKAKLRMVGACRNIGMLQSSTGSVPHFKLTVKNKLWIKILLMVSRASRKLQHPLTILSIKEMK